MVCGRSAPAACWTRCWHEAFATEAALAIDSARLYAESEEKARLDRDLRIAAEIQRALLPEPLWETSWLDLAAASKPCRTIGGDFFDYLDLDDRTIGFGLGDVAGKGPPAALLAVAVQSHFVAHAHVSSDPALAMANLNQVLLRRPIEARFATMFYGIVTADGRLSFCNAGHEPPFVLARNGVTWLEAGGPVLGLMANASYDYRTVTLEPGDLIVICSDGVTEAVNQAEAEFGRDRILTAVRDRRSQRADATLDHLMATVGRFVDGTVQADDLTAMVLRYRGR